MVQRTPVMATFVIRLEADIVIQSVAGVLLDLNTNIAESARFSDSKI